MDNCYIISYIFAKSTPTSAEEDGIAGVKKFYFWPGTDAV